jgi:zeaxanthin glucosyltransferase
MHFGIVSPPVPGHIHPFAALGRELMARGHRVTFFQMADLEEKIRSEGLEFRAVGQDDFPPGSLRYWLDRIGRLKGVGALRLTIRVVERTTNMMCRDAPVALRATGIEALLVDQMEPAGGALAEHLRLPFVTVCNALALNRDPVVPPPFTPWPYSNGMWARLRNQVGYRASDWLTRPITTVVGEYRKAWNLPRLRVPDDSFSRLAQICQMPGELDFPHSQLPPHFHYVGPLRRPLTTASPFPWERLDGRPIVYASLGTLQNNREALFRCFAEACRGLDLQLVISHGGGLTDGEARGLPGNPLVVPYAPQVELLEKARLAITHAGLNTVLDSLANGVPLVMTPITYEQPAIARRVEWTGAGRSLSLRRLTASRLRCTVQSVLADTSFQRSAAQIADAIRRSGGVARAADIIEHVVQTHLSS